MIRYWDLPFHKRMGLRIHIALCFVCGRYNTQILVLQETAKAFLEQEKKGGPSKPVKLDDEACDRIKAQMRGQIDSAD
jgi:hypothetical protein